MKLSPLLCIEWTGEWGGGVGWGESERSNQKFSSICHRIYHIESNPNSCIVDLK